MFWRTLITISLFAILLSGATCSTGQGDTTGTDTTNNGNNQNNGNTGDTGNNNNNTNTPAALAAASGLDQTIVQVASAQLNGTASGGTPPYTFAWTQVSGPAVAFQNANSAAATASSVKLGAAVLRLTVTDSTGATAFDDLQLTITPAALPADVLVVNIANASPGDGTTWDKAFADLQAALTAAAAAPAGTIKEIWVAKGVYLPSPSDRTVSFKLLDQINLYGGFAGDEPLRNLRDPPANLTTLGGDLNANDGPDFIKRGDNSKTIVYAAGLKEATTLDGFTVRGGQEDTLGGVIAVITGGLTIANCIITDNSGGATSSGAVRFAGATGTVENCTFDTNKMDTAGGVQCDTSEVSFSKCTFKANSAANGGAAYVDKGSATFTDCSFAHNTAATTGFGGAIVVNASGKLFLTRCQFDTNSASNGGAVTEINSSMLTVTSCTFLNNSSKANGSGIYSTSANLSVANSLFFGNHADIYGVVYAVGPNAVVTDCTVADNTSKSFPGLFIPSPVGTVTNCILWGNTSTTLPDSPANQINGSIGVTITFCDWQFLPTATGNNIITDPMFVDPVNGDYHLQAMSPCIDKGSNAAVPAAVTTDLGGGQRIKGTPPIVDIGAFEF